MQNQVTLEVFREMLYSFLNVKSVEKDQKQQFKNLEQTINAFTKTKLCWEHTLKLLQLQNVKEILYFASNILKDKLKFDFGQLNAESFKYVHNSLLNIIAKNLNSDRTIQYNLAISVVYLYMHTSDHIGELLPYLQHNFSTSINYMFTILMVLPEQINNFKVVIQEQKREKLLKYMKSNIQKQILVELNNSAQKFWGSKELKKSTFLNCFTNWVSLGLQDQVLNEIHNHFLINAAIQNISDTDISDDCSQCLCKIIKIIEQPKKCKTLYLFLVEKIFKFFETIKKLIKNEMYEECRNYVEVLCKLGRKSAQQFVKSPNQIVFQYLQNMADITSISQLDCYSQINKFWIKFLSQLSKQENKQIVTIYKNFVQKFYLILCKIICFTNFQLEQLNLKPQSRLQGQNQQFENKMKNRQNFIQIFDYISQIIGVNKCIQLSSISIQSLLCSSNNINWAQLECILFPLIPLVEQINQQTEPLTILVVKALQLESPFVSVKKTIIQFLSASSSLYNQRIDIIYKLFSYIVTRLEDVKLIKSAAKAFENICENNTEFVVNNIKGFMQLFKNLKNNERIVLGIAKAISTNTQNLNIYLPQICTPFAEDLIKFQSVQIAKNSLNRLGDIISKIDTQQITNYEPIVSRVFSEIWLIIKQLITNMGQNNPIIIQKSCRFLKYSMRCLKASFGPFINQVFSTIINLYRQYAISSYVYVAQVVITVFNKNQQYLPTIIQIYETICEITFAHLSKLEKFEQNPDLAEDFFGMNVRFMRYAPQIVLQSSKLGGILELCRIACGVQHKQIAKTVYSFLECMFQIYWSESTIEEYNKNQTEQNQLKITKKVQDKQLLANIKPHILNSLLLNKMINHLALVPSTSVRNCILDALVAEIKTWDPQNASIWTPVLVQIGEDILTQAEKVKMITQLSQQSQENQAQLSDSFYLISKRFLHRSLRSPIQ